MNECKKQNDAQMGLFNVFFKMRNIQTSDKLNSKIFVVRFERRLMCLRYDKLKEKQCFYTRLNYI